MTLPTASPLMVCLGAHILDIFGRPVTAIPPGQGSVLLEEIRLGLGSDAGLTSLTQALDLIPGHVTSTRSNMETPR